MTYARRIRRAPAPSAARVADGAADRKIAVPIDITPRALLLDFGSVISMSSFENHRKTERLLNLPPGSLTWSDP